MAFVLPKKFTDVNTPQPNDGSLSVFEDKGGYFAAIRYSGYTNTSKEKEYTEILQELLQKENITPSGSPKILVYNSPYKIINRRNEILIPISLKVEKND
jgi:DNA gyrase inhibitor GyrI